MTDPLRPHRHEPNFTPPGADPTFILNSPSGETFSVTVTDLQALPAVTLSNCYIVSTGHGTSGPFAFSGPTLLNVISAYVPPGVWWTQVEVISADGFGNRVMAHELHNPSSAGPIILACAIEAKPMTRREGLVRLIVPTEKDDALRQVKWVSRINVLG